MEQLISCQKCRANDCRAIKFQAVDPHSVKEIGMNFHSSRFEKQQVINNLSSLSLKVKRNFKTLHRLGVGEVKCKWLQNDTLYSKVQSVQAVLNFTIFCCKII